MSASAAFELAVWNSLALVILAVMIGFAIGGRK